MWSFPYSLSAPQKRVAHVGACVDQFMPDGAGGRLLTDNMRCHVTQIGRVFGRQGTAPDGNIRLGAMHSQEFVCIHPHCISGVLCANFKVLCCRLASL